MRPKVVILIVVVAFGLLGLVAILKGVAGKNTVNPDGPAPLTPTNVVSETPTNPPSSPSLTMSSNQMAVAEAVRTALVDKQIDEIHALQGQADGSNNPVIITALLEKFSNAEAEVRKGALSALRDLNDTNAVPGLQKVADSLKDPREKVAVLDTIDYLKLPSILPTRSEDTTNTPGKK